MATTDEMNLTELITQEFRKGKWLTAGQVAEQFDCSKGMLHQVQLKLRKEGFEIEREQIDGGQVRFRLGSKAPKTAARGRKSNGNGNAAPPVAAAPVPSTAPVPSPAPGIVAAPAEYPMLGATLTVYGVLLEGRVLLQAEDGQRWEATLAGV